MEINKSIIKSFWKQKAKDVSNRWTSKEMLEWEIFFVKKFIPSAKSILDLGSGHGDLSRAVSNETIELTAVDWEPGFRDAFGSENHKFIESSVIDFDTANQYDLVFLMGVVTCLNHPEEIILYQKIKKFIGLKGKALIKNQCAIDDEIIINKFSKELNAIYSARYPSYRRQITDLRLHFESVSVINYPSQFNKWNNTFHVMFICSN